MEVLQQTQQYTGASTEGTVATFTLDIILIVIVLQKHYLQLISRCRLSSRAKFSSTVIDREYQCVPLEGKRLLIVHTVLCLVLCLLSVAIVYYLLAKSCEVISIQGLMK